jgi:hypothetical protein
VALDDEPPAARRRVGTCGLGGDREVALGAVLRQLFPVTLSCHGAEYPVTTTLM